MKSRGLRLVLILDPRGLIGRGGFSVISRHLTYADLLKKNSGHKSSLMVLTLRSRDLSSSNSEIFLAFSNSLTWMFGSILFILRNRSRIGLFVAGNPWESFWLALILKSTLCRNSKVQIQIHGDFFGPIWRTLAMRNAMRFKTLPFVISMCDSVRFVGRHQMSEAIRMFPKLKKKSFLSPLQFSLGNYQPQSFSLSSHFSVGIVGRLHPDKGVDSAMKILHCMKIFDYTFSAVFVGDGPMKDQIREELEKLDVCYKITGHLTGDELDEVWCTLDLILSVAPAESYGLVPREALSRGKRVIGLQNAGIKDLMLDLPDWSGLEVLPSNWDCGSIKLVLQRLELHQPLMGNRVLFADQLEDALNHLIESWL
jgi:glycosyltransferase involved in cell wall biosynthesis